MDKYLSDSNAKPLPDFFLGKPREIPAKTAPKAEYAAPLTNGPTTV